MTSASYGLVGVAGQSAPLAENVPEIVSPHYAIWAGFLGAAGPLPTLTPTSTPTMAPSSTPTPTPTDTPTATPTSTALTATLAFSPTSGVYTQKMSITETHFGASELVNIYGNIAGSTSIYSTTAAIGGAFSIVRTVLQGVHGLHLLAAVGQTSAMSATAPFTIAALTTLQHAQGDQDSVDVLSGARFGAHETVKGYWSRISAAPFTVTATTTSLTSFGAVAGAAGITFTVPFSPAGVYAVYGLGQSSKALGLTYFTIKPALYLKPSSGKAGSAVQVVGTGYGAHETVTLKFDCGTPSCTSTTVLGMPATNGNGVFSTTVTIPAGSGTAAHSIGGKAGICGVFAAATFGVTP